jgi:hypothetical protein
MKITECIAQTADTQVKTQQHDLGAVQQSSQSAISSEVENVIQTLTVEIAPQNFTRR